MPNSASLHLPEPWLRAVRDILRASLPEAEVWAYGSRVNGDHYDASDLDLVVRFPDVVDGSRRYALLDAAKTAFIESNLPIIVQIIDWDAIPQRFRDEIQAGYVVVRTAGGLASGAGHADDRAG